jgi:predicted oxidoreductase (fatty acid repression mutant protein)
MAAKKLSQEKLQIIQDKYYSILVHIDEKITAQLKDEFAAIAHYKGDLSRAYKEIAGQRNSLIGIMQDILMKQDQMIEFMQELHKQTTGKFYNPQLNYYVESE